MKLKNNWRQKSLEILENQNWADPAIAPTNLVKRCIELRKIPIDNFSLSDLRLMIGQHFEIIKNKRQKLTYLKILTTKFDNSKFR